MFENKKFEFAFAGQERKFGPTKISRYTVASQPCTQAARLSYMSGRVCVCVCGGGGGAIFDFLSL